MDFSFTEEQQMIRDTAESFLAETSTSAAVRVAMQSSDGYDPQLWQRICQNLYWQAIHIPEQSGGVGLGYVELVALLEQMGRFLLCSPYFSTVCLAVNTILKLGSQKQRDHCLPGLCEGQTATLAFVNKTASDAGGSWGVEGIFASYIRRGSGFLLNGEYRYVIDGASADLLVVAAREQGSVGQEGISVFVVPAAHPGIEITSLPTLDQTRRQAAIRLCNLSLDESALLGDEGRAWPGLSQAIDLAVIALAAEQLGGAQQVLDMAVSYSQERVQFNRPIASFQAIKHMAADMMLRVEAARSAVYYAGCVAQETLEPGTPCTEKLRQGLAEAASIAKAYCSDAYFKNASDALQIHGGVGFTWEYDVHLYFKRAKASEHFLGSSAYHYDRLADQLLGVRRAQPLRSRDETTG